MKKQMLSLSFRPKNFDEVIGQDKLLKQITKYAESERFPTVLLFTGESGSGKTSLARIIAASLQCTHSKKFGHPCKKCYKHKSDYDITEINASDLTGIDELRKAVDGADCYPKHGSNYRVYILDELHKASKSAQNMLLKYLEDSPKTTIYIICTTEPDNLLETLRSRCLIYTFKSLDESGVRQLCTRVIDKLHLKEKFSALQLAEALTDQDITSARLVMHALQKYIAGATPEEAAEVAVATGANFKAITRSLVRGDWDGVRTELKKVSNTEARAVRRSLAAYLKSMLLDAEDIDDRSRSIAKAISRLAFTAEDSVVAANMAAICLDLCKTFRKYSL